MKILYLNIAGTIIIFLLFVTCNNNSIITKSQYVTNFEGFISTTEGNYQNYDSAAWEKANVQFKEFSETSFNKYKKELDENEKLKVDRLIGSYYSFVAKYHAAQAKENMKRVYNQAESFIDNLLK